MDPQRAFSSFSDEFCGLVLLLIEFIMEARMESVILNPYYSLRWCIKCVPFHGGHSGFVREPEQTIPDQINFFGLALVSSSQQNPHSALGKLLIHVLLPSHRKMSCYKCTHRGPHCQVIHEDKSACLSWICIISCLIKCCLPSLGHGQ